MNDALLLVDVINDFRHEDGDALLASFRKCHPMLAAALAAAREADLPVVYANDNFGAWDGDAPRLVRTAVEGEAGELVEAIAPRAGDRFVAATEMCVVQTAIDAKEEGFKVSILADACATPDARIEQLALEYAESIVGARIERGSEPSSSG